MARQGIPETVTVFCVIQPILSWWIGWSIRTERSHIRRTPLKYSLKAWASWLMSPIARPSWIGSKVTAMFSVLDGNTTNWYHRTQRAINDKDATLKVHYFTIIVKNLQIPIVLQLKGCVVQFLCITLCQELTDRKFNETEDLAILGGSTKWSAFNFHRRREMASGKWSVAQMVTQYCFVYRWLYAGKWIVTLWYCQQAWSVTPIRKSNSLW